ncbi:GTPase-activating protein [Apiospora rasikravindrae]|uniref:GTPase-activating protein n=1 Tax=Apiospora rasikravindrae TaxID=990691 RepID=A0ABR1UBF5_9PEZI
MFSSSGSGKKPPPQQVRVLRPSASVHGFDDLGAEYGFSSASPFWRPSRDGTPKKNGNSSRNSSRDPNKVIGAAYSHADMLKFDSLSLSNASSRPKTPPSSSSQKPRLSDVSSPGRHSSNASSPPLKTYFSFLSNTNQDWNTEDPEGEDMYGYDDDDGDDFGLPSISNMKRKSRRKAAAQGSAASQGNSAPPMDDAFGHSRRYSDSADIAIERPSTTYPMPKKSEGKILRPQYKDILKAIPANATPKEIDVMNSRVTKINKFKKLLQATTIPITDLRALAWGGVPEEVRAMTWQLLLSYLPTSSERRVATLERKRKEYLDGVRQAFERGGNAPSSAGRSRGLDEAVWHQISIDVPRTNPHIELYGHPASGYVQGINDLVSPFWQVFLGSYITDCNIESGMDPGQLPKAVLDAVEADSFCCTTGNSAPGCRAEDLTARIDSDLAKHLENEHVEFIQFSFRWMNCLLMREVSVKNTIRMWDTYLAEEQGFSEFHLYVCAAFLVKWSAKLLKMDFQEIMMFLQALPTKDWTEKDIELLLSEAYIWQSLFKNSAAHLRGGPSRSPSANMQL